MFIAVYLVIIYFATYFITFKEREREKKEKFGVVVEYKPFIR